MLFCLIRQMFGRFIVFLKGYLDHQVLVLSSQDYHMNTLRWCLLKCQRPSLTASSQITSYVIHKLPYYSLYHSKLVDTKFLFFAILFSYLSVETEHLEKNCHHPVHRWCRLQKWMKEFLGSRKSRQQHKNAWCFK